MMLTAVLVAQLAGIVDLSDTSRLDARFTYPLPITPDGKGQILIGADFATSPIARLILKNRRFAFTASYAPTFTAPDFEIPVAPELFQTLSTSAVWRDRHVTTTLLETASYGQFNASYLYANPQATSGTGTTPPIMGMPPPGVTTAATTETIRNLGTETDAIVSVRTDHRFTMTLFGGYLVRGGPDSDSQAVSPQQYGPLGTLTLAYRTSPHDTVSTVLSGQGLETYGGCPPQVNGPAQPLSATTPFCREAAVLGILQETFQHVISPRVRFSIGAGASADLETPLGTEPVQSVVPHEVAILPYGLATFAYRFDTENNLTCTAQFGPTVDVRTGLVDPRAQLTVTLTKVVRGGLTVAVTGSGAKSVPVAGPDPYAVTFLNGLAETRVLLNRQVTLLAGLSAIWETQGGYGSFGSVLGYVGVRAALPTLRF
jgi:hypothetical protein